METDRLADAVHQLAREHVVSSPFNGKRHFERHGPLIEQLRDAAINGVINDGGGGKRSPRERMPLDPDAFQKYENVSAQVSSFYLEYVGERPTRGSNPEAQLTRALVSFTNRVRAGNVNESLRESVTRRWERWVVTIEDKLAGLTSLEITAPCPVCEFEWIIDKDGEQVRALIATYKDDLLGGLSETFARCRCCGETWNGDGQLRRLRILIDEKENSSAS